MMKRANALAACGNRVRLDTNAGADANARPFQRIPARDAVHGPRCSRGPDAARRRETPGSSFFF
jgi:hypothetical protein